MKITLSVKSGKRILGPENDTCKQLGEKPHLLCFINQDENESEKPERKTRPRYVTVQRP